MAYESQTSHSPGPTCSPSPDSVVAMRHRLEERGHHPQCDSTFPLPPLPPRRLGLSEKAKVDGQRLTEAKRPLWTERALLTPPEFSINQARTKRSRPFDAAITNDHGAWWSWKHKGTPKRKGNFFESAFALRSPVGSAGERTSRDFVMVANVQLNFCLDSGQEFLGDLSFLLSEIYQRPMSSVMVVLTTDSQIMLGGFTEPTYQLTLHALQPEIAATKNKRSTYFIQDFMHQTVHVSPRRGVVRFEAVTEDNIAINGATASQEIERLNRQPKDEGRPWTTDARQSGGQKSRPHRPLAVCTDASRLAEDSENTAHDSWASIVERDSRSEKQKDSSVPIPGLRRLKQRKSILTFFRSTKQPELEI